MADRWTNIGLCTMNNISAVSVSLDEPCVQTSKPCECEVRSNSESLFLIIFLTSFMLNNRSSRSSATCVTTHILSAVTAVLVGSVHAC